MAFHSTFVPGVIVTFIRSSEIMIGKILSTEKKPSGQIHYRIAVYGGGIKTVHNNLVKFTPNHLTLVRGTARASLLDDLKSQTIRVKQSANEAAELIDQLAELPLY